MPELPEVETIRRRLEPLLTGRRFEQVEINDLRLTRPEPPEAVAHALAGQRVRSLDRRGKYLIVTFEGDPRLLVHLRMTGNLRRHPARQGGPDEDPYRRALVRLDDGAELVYRDVRRFGTWCLVSEGDLHPYLDERLGLEPLDRAFTPARLAAALAGRRTALKAAVLDQKVVAGIGNIYADEGLWWARLHPQRPAGSLDQDELAALRRGLREAIRRGIERQGATLRDYTDPDGGAGQMQDEFRVYGRDGERCLRCRSPIEKSRVAGRGTWFCTRCQT